MLFLWVQLQYNNRMKKHFYSHLVEKKTLIIALNELPLSEDEKIDLLVLIDSNLQHVILDAILSELKEEDKVEFLKHLTHNDHDKVWAFLNDRVEDIEEKIKKAASTFHKKLHNDIKEVKKKK